MVKKSVVLGIAAFSLSFLACGLGSGRTSSSNSESTESGDSQSENTIHVMVTGDLSATFDLKGERVSAAFMGYANDTLRAFTVGFNQDDVLMMTGMMNLDLNSRMEQTGSNLANFDFNREGEDWQKKFNSQYYSLFYDINVDQRDSKTYITLTNVEKLPDGYLLVEGKYRFNAANNPGAENLSPACLNDALKNPDRRPVYLASLAGTSQVNVQGDFSVVVLVKAFGW